MANSLLAGAAFFTGLSYQMEGATKKAITKSARVIQREAQRVLGTYDYGWKPLKEETVKHKATGDSPLLETGELRASIKISVSGTRGHWEATVGSNNPKALWQELGTSRGIPPRPFLMGAAIRKEEEVRKICGHDTFHWLLTSKSPEPDDAGDD